MDKSYSSMGLVDPEYVQVGPYYINCDVVIELTFRKNSKKTWKQVGITLYRFSNNNVKTLDGFNTS